MQFIVLESFVIKSGIIFVKLDQLKRIQCTEIHDICRVLYVYMLQCMDSYHGFLYGMACN